MGFLCREHPFVQPPPPTSAWAGRTGCVGVHIERNGPAAQAGTHAPLERVAARPCLALHEIEQTVPRSGFVYILASKPNGTLYIGVTSDLPRRLADHRAGVASAFTAAHGVTRLVYVEPYADIREAIVREKRLKKWNRSWKLRLIREQNPTWKDLYEDVMRQPGERGAIASRRMGPRLRGDDSIGR